MCLALRRALISSVIFIFYRWVENKSNIAVQLVNILRKERKRTAILLHSGLSVQVGARKIIATACSSFSFSSLFDYIRMNLSFLFGSLLCLCSLSLFLLLFT